MSESELQKLLRESKADYVATRVIAPDFERRLLVLLKSEAAGILRDHGFDGAAAILSGLPSALIEEVKAAAIARVHDASSPIDHGLVLSVSELQLQAVHFRIALDAFFLALGKVRYQISATNRDPNAN